MSRPKRIAIYPGTFDPITLGHLNIIQRAAQLADMLVVAVAENAEKTPMFDVETRVNMIKRDIHNLNNINIIVKPFDNLLVEFAKQMGASFVVRGLRTGTDYEYENQMAAVNHCMCPEIDTILMFATVGTGFVASSIVKSIARLGGDVSPFVTPEVAADLAAYFLPESKRPMETRKPGQKLTS